MLTVHHLGISQSERIVWLCEELGLDCRLVRYERREDNRMAPEEFKALHPMGIAPVITDDEVTLGESGAIIDYICGKYGAKDLVPAPDDPDFADHCFWYHFANATFMATLMVQLALALNDASDGPAAGFVHERAKRQWSMLENRLTHKPFIGGQRLTTADIMLVYCLTTNHAFRGTTNEGLPNIQAYLKRIAERPAYQRAMAKAEPSMQPMIV